MLAIDGTNPADLREMLESELDSIAESDEQVPLVFEAAGGISPYCRHHRSCTRTHSSDATLAEYR